MNTNAYTAAKCAAARIAHQPQKMMIISIVPHAIATSKTGLVFGVINPAVFAKSISSVNNVKLCAVQHS